MDRLQRVKCRPGLVEDAVRTALRDAIAWRLGGGVAPGDDAFTAAAVASARLDLDALDGDPDERSRALAAVARAARRFAATALCRRLMAVPAARFLRLREPGATDAMVRDRRGRLHAIVLTIRSDALETARLATQIASAVALPVPDRLAPLTIHVLSLSGGYRHVFVRDLPSSSAHTRTARVA